MAVFCVCVCVCAIQRQIHMFVYIPIAMQADCWNMNVHVCWWCQCQCSLVSAVWLHAVNHISACCAWQTRWREGLEWRWWECWERAEGRGMCILRVLLRSLSLMFMTIHAHYTLRFHTHTHMETHTCTDKNFRVGGGETRMEQAENSLLINTIILKLQRQQVASIIGKSKENSTEKFKGRIKLQCMHKYV